MDDSQRRSNRVALGATTVDACTFDEAVEGVLALVGRPGHHLVVTPNVDHLVMLEQDHEFADAYDDAALRFVDGAPLVLLARLLGTPVPGRIAGIDLTEHLFRDVRCSGRTAFLLGGAPEVLERAVRKVVDSDPTLRIIGWAAPAIDLDAPSADEERVLAQLRDDPPDLLFIFLGAPKQEKWFVRRAAMLPDVVALAVGGTVDLLAGDRRRAPRWIQRVGFEWLWRLAHEPRRLAGRYLVRDRRFLRIAAHQLREQRLRASRRADKR